MLGYAQRKQVEANARMAAINADHAASVKWAGRLPGASPEATAFAFGAMLQREYGNDWPRLIGIIGQAAMNADHGISDPCFSPADMG
jgi:hypothetical protein